jgi:hypothetical protein
VCGTLWRHKLSSTETGHHCGVGKLSSGPGPYGAHGTCELERAGSTSGHAGGGSTVHVFTSRLTNWVSITELQQGSVKVTRPSPPRTQVSSSPSRGHLHTGDVGLSARLKTVVCGILLVAPHSNVPSLAAQGQEVNGSGEGGL